MEDKMLKGKGKFNVYGSKAIISIPSTVWKDSQYPFKRGEEVEIEIDKDELKIRKIERRKKIEGRVLLVVDDEPEVQELVKAYLSPLNIEVYSAYDGEEGVKLYKELMEKGKKPDLVVMDLNLSGSRRNEDMIKQMMGEEMDGVRTTEEIMKIDPSAKVIGFTAYADLEWAEGLKMSGAREVLGRGVGFDGFAKRVGEILV